mmetsp:Transcript_41998/g.97423  ORF Transcript_41998/g.97423 Transcript_41998/m.97423 type:complete len:490 (+) Transcript_41998:96-1565(+)
MRAAALTWGFTLIALCDGKVMERHFNGMVSQYAHNGDSDMAYIGKFCFQCVGECGRQHGNQRSRDDLAHTLAYEAGMVRVNAHGGYQPGQVLAIFLSEHFYDQTRSWRHVYRNSQLTCRQKLAKAIDVIELTPSPGPNASLTYEDEYAPDANVQRTEYIELSARPQFFHFAAMNCEENQLYMFIELKLFNPGSFRNRQFSFEDQGLLTLEAIMFVFSIGLACAALQSVLSLSSSKIHHPPLLIFHNALWLGALSHAIALFFYNSYGTHGHAPELALMMSEMLFLSMDLIVMILCLLIARGWRVTVTHLEKRESFMIIAAAGAYVMVYALVYCADMVTRDPADDIYPLMTGGALWLIFFRLLLGGLCAYFVMITYKLEMSPAKRQFYRRFNSAAALWFLAQPIAIILALSMDEWVRHKNATAVLYFVTHSILAVVLVVLRPARAQNYFTMTALEGELDGLVNRAGRGAAGPGSFPQASGHALFRDEDEER